MHGNVRRVVIGSVLTILYATSGAGAFYEGKAKFMAIALVVLFLVFFIRNLVRRRRNNAR